MEGAQQQYLKRLVGLQSLCLVLLKKLILRLDLGGYKSAKVATDFIDFGWNTLCTVHVAR